MQDSGYLWVLADIFENVEDADRDLLQNEGIAMELLSALLEYLKYSVNTILPTQLYEAQLDYFSKHIFDLKSEPRGEAKTGHHHYEWKPA